MVVARVTAGQLVWRARWCAASEALRGHTPTHAAQLHLTRSNNKISKTKNDSFSGLSLFERLPWLMLPQETRWMIRAAMGSYVQGCFFCGDIDDCRLITENVRHRRLFYDNLPCPPIKVTVPRYKVIEKRPQNYDKNVDGFWWGWGKSSVFFKGLATGSLTVLHWVYGQHKLDVFPPFFLFLLFWGRGAGIDHKSRG